MEGKKPRKRVPLGSKRRVQLDTNMKRWRAVGLKMAKMSGGSAREIVDTIKVSDIYSREVHVISAFE